MQETDPYRINLNINGQNRIAHAGWDPEKQQYWAEVPAAQLVDGSDMGEINPTVQGHFATYDKDGKLLGVEALGWGSEGGFYDTKWPTPADSVYNANAAKTYAPQVFKQVKRQENGGNMNYSQYLQEGGAAPQQDAQDAQQQIIALVQAAMSGDKDAADQINQIMQAAQQGDQQAAQIAGLIQEVAQQMQGGAEAMKCGGKVKAKVKKKEVGGFVKKAGTGCACQLKKVGGRLIEVDGCTGLPVKRNGGIMKFETPAQRITYTDIPNSLYSIGSDGQLYQKTTFNGNTHYSNPIPYNENSRKNINTRDYFRGYGHTYNGMYFNPGLKKFVPAGKKFFKAKNGDVKVVVNERGDIFYGNGRYYNQQTGKMESYAPDAIEGGWDSYWGNTSTQNTQTNTQSTAQSATTQNSKATASATGSGAATGNEAPQYTIGQAGTGDNAGKVWNGNAWAKQTYWQENAARAGMVNADGTGWNVDKRKEWMNSDEVKAYLASINNGQGLGFTTDQYTGTAAQNRALFGAYRGYNAWKAEKDAAAAATDPNANKQQMRDVSYTNQQLLDMADDDPRLAANPQLKAARDKAKSAYDNVQFYNKSYQELQKRNEGIVSHRNSVAMDSAMQGAAHDKLAQGRFDNSLAALNRVKVFNMDDAARQAYFKTLSPAERLRQQRLYNAQLEARNKYKTLPIMTSDQNQAFMKKFFDANAVGYTGQEPVTAQKFGGTISYYNYTK